MPAGRPKGTEKPVDIEELKKWARAGATYPEMAQRLGISHGTLETRLLRPEYRQALEEAKSEMIISLRSKQVAMALAGNVTMLIWLGKQYLGQKDKLEHAGTGPGGAISVAHSTPGDLIKADLAALHERIAPKTENE